MDYKQARQLRKLLELQTENLTDQEALEVATFVERWKPDMHYKADKRVSVQEGENIILYKVVQEHTSQAQYPPSQTTAALYARIDVVHAGTIEDPIPYAVNMEVYADKYYTEDGILYKCIRDSGIALQNRAADLIGSYFELT